MATIAETTQTQRGSHDTSNLTRISNCDWFNPETGIYSSKQKLIQLPTYPYLDVVSLIFSHKHNGVTALIDSSSGFTIPYSKLPQMVKSMASGLYEIGISQGDIVSILLPNTIYFPIIYLGILSIGAIATATNPLSSLPEIEKQVIQCRTSFVFTTVGKVKEIEKMGVGVIAVPENVDSFTNSPEFSCFNKLLSSDPNLAPKPIINQEDTAAILFSSGTSGPSKGVVMTHGNLIASVELFVRFEASQYNYPASENVYLATLPLFHVYGLSLLATGLLSLGTKVVVMRKFSEDEMVRAIDKYRVTHIPAVPPIVMSLLRIKKSGHKFPSLKQVSSGAAPASKPLLEEFLRNFPSVDFIQGYGMTETTAVGTRGFNKDTIKYTSIGLLAPNMQAKVINPISGFSMPPGKSGELWLRGPGIMKGYLKNEDATKSTIDKDGWLHTGDITYFDQDGYIYVVDRLKEIIKYKGFQIAPADLESVLISHPDILDAAVTGAVDEIAGEIPIAFVVKMPGSSLSEADVMTHVAGKVAPYKKVRKVIFTRSIPRSPAGKILRRLLKETLMSRI
ncbi:4-coumarate--CoA ligase-like 6 [Macadamia integrifolia]|uniref:4-coumarate--CoA ligase-like 6 n=1 Tax=Macadamia integrifolia TaxID=60698 RepID=UPI001C4E7E80|nr:4-coumarate--CoA ligase-like 6 [Macadamia integrifolia]